MAIKSKSEMPSEITVDLTGPNGNAFALIGLAQKLAKQLEYDGNERGKLTADMMSGDYEHLLKVFEEHFGSFVTLYR